MSVTLPPASSQIPPTDQELKEYLRQAGPAIVALSGGVDSSLVAALARDALGEGAMAITLAGPAVAKVEVDRAREVAKFLGIAHTILPIDPLGSPEYRSNPSNRCYFCRSIEAMAIRDWGYAHGFQRFLDGVQLDDLGDERPGVRALDEAGFEHPLLWARWNKLRVRKEARVRGLPNSEQPSDACLASRVAHGQVISAELLTRIQQAEQLVRQEGFLRVRVRVRDDVARIEVGPEEVQRLQGDPLATRVCKAIEGLGFPVVTIDPSGYRTKSGA